MLLNGGDQAELELPFVLVANMAWELGVCVRVYPEVLEGPEDTAEKALVELVRLMENPLAFRLRVPLKVSACHVQTWLDAKG